MIWAEFRIAQIKTLPNGNPREWKPPNSRKRGSWPEDTGNNDRHFPSRFIRRENICSGPPESLSPLGNARAGVEGTLCEGFFPQEKALGTMLAMARWLLAVGWALTCLVLSVEETLSAQQTNWAESMAATQRAYQQADYPEAERMLL